MAFDILMVTSEAWPLAKTGGLGDAVGGLARAAGSEHMPVTIMMPAWRTTLGKLRDVRHVARLRDLPGGPADLLSGYCDELSCRVLLLRNDDLYDRDGLYVGADGDEYDDNAVRFAALSKAAAHVACGLDGVPVPAIVHAHDWHAALVPVYMHQLGASEVKTVLTLHNVAFQGVYPMEHASQLDLRPEYLTSGCLEYWGKLNFLKAGLLYADRITVVSHNYAREILTPRFGCGLEGLLAACSGKTLAIPNGIDTRLWNAARDSFLGNKTFTADRLDNKAACKRVLQEVYDLEPVRESFLLAMGSRLTEQKMADVAARVLPQALERFPELQLCVVGCGDRRAERELAALAGRYPRRCGVHIGYSEARAHWLHAGADALLHGSRFEPFGLTPLYAMRYGTIPIASRVGGMVDTIVDPGGHDSMTSLFRATGILFDGDSDADMMGGIERAVALRKYPLIWRTMQRNAMMAPTGWERTAPLYADLYRSLRPDVEPVRTANRAALVPHEARRDARRMPARPRTASAVDTVVPTGTSVA